MTILAPSRAARNAIASPMPRDAPVMNSVLPWSEFIVDSPSVLERPMHDQDIGQATLAMAKRTRHATQYAKAVLLPEPDRMLVAGDDEIELHRRIAALACGGQ